MGATDDTAPGAERVQVGGVEGIAEQASLHLPAAAADHLTARDPKHCACPVQVRALPVLDLAVFGRKQSFAQGS